MSNKPYLLALYCDDIGIAEIELDLPPIIPRKGEIIDWETKDYTESPWKECHGRFKVLSVEYHYHFHSGSYQAILLEVEPEIEGEPGLGII